ncbi:MAG TPA: glycosyltransferase family 4 protein [Blastocatellia bacterium]|nr:glycosyltransferase family 4 protein [Blastocatellia bacterium]
MKILLYSKAFHPMVGGIETVTATMAELLNKLGHQCDVLTPVENAEPDAFDYKVHRRPGFLKKIKVVLDADIVISKGASLAMVPYCLILGRPFIWVHAGYQASCVDGLGWVDGIPAPMTPKASIAFHYRKSGLLFAARAALKLYIRRFACKRIVTMNVAVSDWVAMRQPFSNQITIHNPFPIYRFSGASQTAEPRYQFLYLGRLVSEKGVGTLIKAFAILVKQNPDDKLRLLVVGEGNWRGRLESLAKESGVENNVEFAGRKTGDELTGLIEQCEIAVVPSEWEEPMGVVALELLAAGKPLIVSKNGGLAECVGDAALLFDNGDHAMLADRMSRLLEDGQLRASLQQKAREQIDKFDPEALVKQYINLFDTVLGARKQQRRGNKDLLISK